MKITSILSVLLPSLFSIHAAVAQIAGDESWFYDYGGPAQSEPFDFEIQGDYLYAGGLFLTTDGVPGDDGKNISRFDLRIESWQALPGLNAGLNGRVDRIHAADDGCLYIGGNFSNAGNTVATRIVKFDPRIDPAITNPWSPLSDPASTLVASNQDNGPTAGQVRGIVKSGDYIYVGGNFSNASWPLNERYIRRFQVSTSQWQPVGAGLAQVSGSAGEIRTVIANPANGEIYVGGNLNPSLAKWNGSAWSTIGGGVNGVVRALALHPDGKLYVGGDFTSVGSGGNLITANDIASYNPSNNTWNNLNGGFDDQYIQSNGTTFDADGVFDLKIAPDGRVIAVGDIQADPARTNTNLDHIAVWDGTGTWKNLGSGVGNTGSQIVNCVEVSWRGDIYVGGVFAEGFRNASSANSTFARFAAAGADLTGYIPGAALNPTLKIQNIGGSMNISLLTRPGTTYQAERSPDLMFTNPVNVGTISGDGTVKSINVGVPNSPKQFFRCRATGF